VAKGKTIGDIDHVVIGVWSIEKAKPFFSELLDTEFMEVAVNEEVGYRSVMSSTGLELLEPTRQDSDVAKYLNKKGEGLYALAFMVPDAGKAKAKAEKMGVRVVGEVIRDSGPLAGLREIWLHPKDNFGVYVMFTQGNPYHP